MNIDDIIKGLNKVMQYPFIAALPKAITGIKEIKIDDAQPNNITLWILFEDGTRCNPTGFYDGMSDADAIELVQVHIEEDRAFKQYQELRSKLLKAFKDDELKAAKDYHDKVISLNQKVDDIKRRRP